MGHLSLDASESLFSSYVGGLLSVVGHADRSRPAAGLLLGLDDAMRAQERRADGGAAGRSKMLLTAG